MPPFSGLGFTLGRDKLDTRTFGGNTGQQGTFDPSDSATSLEALQRLQALQQRFGPMLSGTFTGKTGFAPNDADSFFDLQNAVVEAKNIRRSFGGKAPLNIRSGGRVGSEFEDARANLGANQFLRAKQSAGQRGVPQSIQSLQDLITGQSLRRQ